MSGELGDRRISFRLQRHPDGATVRCTPVSVSDYIHQYSHRSLGERDAWGGREH